jgi:hypothetical protein
MAGRAEEGEGNNKSGGRDIPQSAAAGAVCPRDSQTEGLRAQRGGEGRSPHRTGKRTPLRGKQKEQPRPTTIASSRLVRVLVGANGPGTTVGNSRRDERWKKEREENRHKHHGGRKGSE